MIKRTRYFLLLLPPIPVTFPRSHHEKEVPHYLIKYMYLARFYS